MELPVTHLISDAVEGVSEVADGLVAASHHTESDTFIDTLTITKEVAKELEDARAHLSNDEIDTLYSAVSESPKLTQQQIDALYEQVTFGIPEPPKLVDPRKKELLHIIHATAVRMLARVLIRLLQDEMRACLEKFHDNWTIRALIEAERQRFEDEAARAIQAGIKGRKSRRDTDEMLKQYLAAQLLYMQHLLTLSHEIHMKVARRTCGFMTCGKPNPW